MQDAVFILDASLQLAAVVSSLSVYKVLGTRIKSWSPDRNAIQARRCLREQCGFAPGLETDFRGFEPPKSKLLGADPVRFLKRRCHARQWDQLMFATRCPMENLEKYTRFKIQMIPILQF